MLIVHARFFFAWILNTSFRIFLCIFLFLISGCNFNVDERMPPNFGGGQFLYSEDEPVDLGIKHKKVELDGSRQGESRPFLASLPLGEIIEIALERNRQVLSSVDSIVSSDLGLTAEKARFETRVAPLSDVGVVGGSGRDGELTYGLGLSVKRQLRHGTVLGLTPSLQTFGERKRSAVGIDITQPILRNFGTETNLDGISSASASLRRSQRVAYQTQVGTVLGTVNAVYRIMRQEELIRLNEASAKRLRAHLAAVKAKLSIGGASRIDLTRAELALSQAEDSLVSARQSRAQAIDALKLFLAFDLDSELSATAPMDYVSIDLDESLAVDLALDQRIELDQARDDIGESRRRVRLANKRILPALDLVASYTRFDDGRNLDDSLDLEGDVWSAGLRVTTDLSRTVEKTALARARLALAETERRVRETEDLVAEDARRALRGLVESEERIAIQRQRIEDAKRQLELARVKFRYGFADNFDLVDAETQMARAEIDLSLVTINHLTGTYQTSAALGILIPRSPKAAARFKSQSAIGLPIYECTNCMVAISAATR